MPKVCPVCGGDNIQVDGARHEGRLATCMECGWSSWNCNYTPPNNPKTPCKNLLANFNASIRIRVNPNLHSDHTWQPDCELETHRIPCPCVNDKKVACRLSWRDRKH